MDARADRTGTSAPSGLAGARGAAGTGPAGRAGRTPGATSGPARGPGRGAGGGGSRAPVAGPDPRPRSGPGRALQAQQDANATRLAAAFAHAFCEVEAGRRSPKQLEQALTPVLYARLARTWVRTGARVGVPSVGRLRVVLTAPGRYEVVAVIRRGARCGALAFRLVQTPHGWRVDDLTRPEDGPLPAPAYPVPSDEPDAFDLVLG